MRYLMVKASFVVIAVHENLDLITFLFNKTLYICRFLLYNVFVESTNRSVILWKD